MRIKSVVRFPKREPPEASIGFTFWQASNLWRRRMDKSLGTLDLTLVQFVLLAGIAWLERFEEPITQARLAKHAKTDAMMTSQVLRTLESRGLVKRKEHESDTRAKSLQITSKGVEIARDATRLVQDVDTRFFISLAKDHRRFLQSLHVLIDANKAKRGD